tara:strand:- start:2093 stop:3202 length:1110 start_codon:yes stop_codon:yes gene_type:complete
MIIDLQIIIIACLVAISASLLGVFLVLRGVSMMSDAISHCVLLGIVGIFFLVKNLHSPLLIIGAMLTGFLAVLLIEYFINSTQMKSDSAIGLVFPFFFAVAILLINLFASSIHIDEQCVLLGEIGFAPLNRLIIYGKDIGPVAIWTMSIVLVINCLFVITFYKELVCSVFDRLLSFSLGFKPTFIYYGLMLCVSLTTVGAFDAVGSILIIALMITPPATAYLLTLKLRQMIIYSIGIGCVNSIVGYYVAVFYDASITGSICIVAAVNFLLAFIFSKHHGLLMRYYLHKQQQLEFSSVLLTIQLLDHEHTEMEPFENSFENLIVHMKWPITFSNKVVAYCLKKEWVVHQQDYFVLTDLGREIAKKALIAV